MTAPALRRIVCRVLEVELFSPIVLGRTLVLEPCVCPHSAVGVLRFVTLSGVEAGRIILAQLSMPHKGDGRAAATRTAIWIGSPVDCCVSRGSWMDVIVSGSGRNSKRNAAQA